MDFQFDQTADGRMLQIVDEFTHEALACDVEYSIDADGLVRCLDRLASSRGAPVYVRFDTNPSSSPMPWSTGAGSPVPRQCPSTRAHRSRTPGSRTPTVGSATSS
jgi:hypothetical protein